MFRFRTQIKCDVITPTIACSLLYRGQVSDNNTLIYSHGLSYNVAWYNHLFWFKVQFLSIAFVSCSVTCLKPMTVESQERFANFLFSSLYCHLGEKLSLKKGLKQCLGGPKCSQNTKKNKKTLKVSFKAIFNVHFANLVSKEYFSIQRLIIFLLYE